MSGDAPTVLGQSSAVEFASYRGSTDEEIGGGWVGRTLESLMGRRAGRRGGSSFHTLTGNVNNRAE